MEKQTEYKYEERCNEQLYSGSLQSKGILRGNVELAIMPLEETLGNDTHYRWFRISDFNVLKEHRKQGWGKLLFSRYSP